MKEQEKVDNKYYRKVFISLIFTALLVIIVIALSFSYYKKLSDGNNNNSDNHNSDSDVRKNNPDDKDSSSKSSSSESSTENDSSLKNGSTGKNNRKNGRKGSKKNNNGKNYSVDNSRLSMNYTESINGISMTNAMPVTDEVGMKQEGKGEYFDFTIKTDLSKNTQIVYEIVAVKDSKSTVQNSDIKLYLEEQKNGTYVKLIDPTNYKPLLTNSDIGAPKGSMVLKRIKCDKSGSYNYRLKMWLDEKASIETEKSFAVRVNVYGAKS